MNPKLIQSIKIGDKKHPITYLEMVEPDGKVFASLSPSSSLEDFLGSKRMRFVDRFFKLLEGARLV